MKPQTENIQPQELPQKHPSTCDTTQASKSSVPSETGTRISDSTANQDSTQNHQPPDVTAQSFIVVDCSSRNILLSRKPTYKREVASLTKMMTLLTVLKLLQRYGFPHDGKRVQIKISKVVSKIIGTTADLKEGDIMTVEQLIYGMMLPSGNDAAYAMAEFFGTVLKERKWPNITDEELKLLPTSYFLNSNVKYFLKEMNF